jgi:serine/threonine-protein kinase PknK
MRRTPSADLGVPGVEDAVPVGRGAFGVVYRAWQPAHHRHVAVKVLDQQVCERDRRARFSRERAASGMLTSHPHVLDVYDSGLSVTDHPYLVMEFMPEGSLGDRVRRAGPLGWATAARHLVELCGALETAHRHGVLHRDIKPENLFVSAFDHAQLGDFGIAEVQGLEEDVRRDSRSATTLLHAAPELFRDEQSNVATDLFALGTSIFVLLAGRDAFLEEGDRTLSPMIERVLRDPLPDLRDEGVPAAVFTVVEVLTAKGPAARYPTAAAAGEAMRRALVALGKHAPSLVLPVDRGGAQDG